MPSISQRTANLGTEHAFVVLAEVNRLVEEGRDIISFAIGQPDFPTPKAICEAAAAAIAQGKHGYTASAGIAELRQAAARYLSRTRGVSYQAEDVVVANGAKPFIMYSILATTDYGLGHEVLYPSPGFPIYESQIIAQGAVPVPLVLRQKNDFRLDIQELDEKLNERSRLLILSSPHNPTGAMLSEVDLAAIAEVLQAYPNCWVLSDEIYSQMVHGDAFASLASQPGMAERTIVVDGVSKSYAMTGWRLGFAANRQLAGYFSSWVTNTDSCASAISQWAAVEALDGDQQAHQEMMASFSRRRDLILGALAELPGLKLTPPGGAFYVWPDVSELCQQAGAVSAEELRKRWLYEAGVAVLADSQFGRPTSEEGQHVRFSYATSEAHILEGIARLKRWVETLPE